MAVRKRDKKYLIEMEVTSIATQTMSGYITQEQLNEYMEYCDESYLRLELSMDDHTEFTDWEYDSLDLEKITIEGGPYKKDFCWLKGKDLKDDWLVSSQKKKLQRMSIINEEIKRLQNMH